MNKLIIPLVLLAVVAIAAGFAFSPVDEATSVHTSLLDAICVHDQANSPSGFWDGDNCDVTEE